jgi:uncharacterized protein YgbK (DUF1537 family)
MTAAAPPADGLPPGLLLSYYGDDFTGSTDAMEAFTAAGLPTVLCLSAPTPALRERFPQARCIGLAGTARGRSPAWMDTHLPDAFTSLARLGAPLLQYKVCSTFDSSPHIGSIGRAIDIGIGVMGGAWSPLLVGVPQLRRYQAFGQLFAAAADGVVHRLDRHPGMSRHPVTPMAEADLLRHLALQTARRGELIDVTTLRAGADEAARRLDAITARGDVPVVSLDVLDEDTLAAAGRLVWQARGAGLFTAASSGLQYALAAHWRERGWLPSQRVLPRAAAVPAIAVVSGSCSPATAAQIAWAAAQGFGMHRLEVARLMSAADAEAEIERAVTAAAAHLAQGRSPLVHTASGPDDPAVTGFAAMAAAAGLGRDGAARRVGEALAAVMRRLLERVPVPRVVVAGGDSSGEVAGALGIDALTVLAGLAPGAPLCRAWSADRRRDGLELVLKGGQMGGADFFGAVRDGVAGRGA